MKGVDLPFKTIEELRDIAYSIVGEPEKVQFGDRVVGIIEARDARSWTLYARSSHMSLLTKQTKNKRLRSRHLFLVRVSNEQTACVSRQWSA